MKKVLLAACGVALTVGGFTPLGLSPAAAETATAATATGFGANLELAGAPAVDRAGLATSTLPPGGDNTDTLILLPADPLAVSFTATGLARTSAEANIPSTFEADSPVQQATAGPYNALAVGLVENLSVVTGVAPAEVPLIEADAVRGEAVGVCRNGVADYDAASRIVNLEVGGNIIPIDTPLTGIIDAVEELIDPLAQVVDIERNVINETANGISIDALRVTVLGAIGGVPIAGQEPLVDLVVGHAEVGGLTCGPRPQCSDTQDNDGDGVIDANDPGCINNGVYDPNDNDERNELPRTTATPTAELPRTGGNDSSTVPVAGGLAVLALGALALRRRSHASAK